MKMFRNTATLRVLMRLEQMIILWFQVSTSNLQIEMLMSTLTAK